MVSTRLEEYLEDKIKSIPDDYKPITMEFAFKRTSFSSTAIKESVSFGACIGLGSLSALVIELGDLAFSIGLGVAGIGGGELDFETRRLYVNGPIIGAASYFSQCLDDVWDNIALKRREELKLREARVAKYIVQIDESSRDIQGEEVKPLFSKKEASVSVMAALFFTDYGFAAAMGVACVGEWIKSKFNRYVNPHPEFYRLQRYISKNIKAYPAQLPGPTPRG